jgi:hypothetical protein
MTKSILLPVLLISIFSFGQQSECEKLAQENRELKIQLGLVNQEVEVKSFNDDFNVKVLGVTGNREMQTVRIEFLIQHSEVHKNVCVSAMKNETKAFDGVGTEYNPKEVGLGTSTQTVSRACNLVPTGVAVKGFIVLRNVLPKVEALKIITIKVTFKNNDGGFKEETGTLEISNAAITWN